MSVLAQLAGATEKARRITPASVALLRTVAEELGGPLQDEFKHWQRLIQFRLKHPYAIVRLIPGPAAQDAGTGPGYSYSRKVRVTDIRDWVSATAIYTAIRNTIAMRLDDDLCARFAGLQSPLGSSEVIDIYVQRDLLSEVRPDELLGEASFEYNFKSQIHITYA